MADGLTSSSSALSLNRTQSVLGSSGRVPVLAPLRAERARLEALLSDVWSYECLPFPGMTTRTRGQNLVRSSASTMMRKLSVASITSSFVRRSSTSATSPSRFFDESDQSPRSTIATRISARESSSEAVDAMPVPAPKFTSEPQQGMSTVPILKDPTAKRLSILQDAAKRRVEETRATSPFVVEFGALDAAIVRLEIQLPERPMVREESRPRRKPAKLQKKRPKDVASPLVPTTKSPLQGSLRLSKSPTTVESGMWNEKGQAPPTCMPTDGKPAGRWARIVEMFGL